MKTTTKKSKQASKKTSRSSAKKGKPSFKVSRKELIVLAIAGVLAIGAGGFLAWQQWQANESDATSCVNRTFKKGSSGTCVKYMQTLVKFHTQRSISVDGNFGQKTKDAVIAFQKQVGIGQDGVVGKTTWKKLCQNKYTSTDKYGNKSTFYLGGFPKKEALAAGCTY